jgi:hypothetical protein
MAQRLSFNDWMAEVDMHLLSMCNMLHDDLPDFLYHDAYMRGSTAKATARKSLASAKKDMGYA